MTSEEFKNKLMNVYRKLFRLSWRFLGNVQEAEDVVQEVYLKLWEMRDKLSNIKNHEAFAITIAKNLSIDKLKKRKAVSIEEITGNSKAIGYFANSPSEALENVENIDLIRNIIGKLPEQQNVIIVMRDFEQYSFEEIQEITGFDLNYIRVNLSRARKQVREEIIKIHNYGTEKNKTTSGKIL